MTSSDPHPPRNPADNGDAVAVISETNYRLMLEVVRRGDGLYAWDPAEADQAVDPLSVLKLVAPVIRSRTRGMTRSARPRERRPSAQAATATKATRGSPDDGDARPRRCANVGCGGPLPAAARADARFCSSRCRLQHHRDRKRPNAAGDALADAAALLHQWSERRAEIWSLLPSANGERRILGAELRDLTAKLNGRSAGDSGRTIEGGDRAYLAGGSGAWADVRAARAERDAAARDADADEDKRRRANPLFRDERGRVIATAEVMRSVFW
jgi:hypothetical protein